jgi:hypothetical protein
MLQRAPFFRLEGSRSKETGGIGLGLSVARAVVWQHGGDIYFATQASCMQAIVSLPNEGCVSIRTSDASFGMPVLKKREAPDPTEIARTLLRTN